LAENPSTLLLIFGISGILYSPGLNKELKKSQHGFAACASFCLETQNCVISPRNEQSRDYEVREALIE